MERLRQQLQKHFPRGDEPGRFLRSANFDYRHFVDGESLRTVYCKNFLLKEYKEYFVGGFYKKLATLIESKE